MCADMAVGATQVCMDVAGVCLQYFRKVLCGDDGALQVQHVQDPKLEVCVHCSCVFVCECERGCETIECLYILYSFPFQNECSVKEFNL